ncbi:hypothetical protein ES703_64937 [subsurface metagenome]
MFLYVPHNLYFAVHPLSNGRDRFTIVKVNGAFDRIRIVVRTSPLIIPVAVVVIEVDKCFANSLAVSLGFIYEIHCVIAVEVITPGVG